MEDKIKHFIYSIFESLTSIWSYLVMLIISLLTNDTRVLFSFFFTMLFLDYVTGILASWVESNGKHKVFLIESKRLRESCVKVCGYMILIICSWFVTILIYPNDVNLFGILNGFNLLELTLIMSIAIESFSNLENVKRMGFDVIGKIKDGASKIHDLIKSIKGN